MTDESAETVAPRPAFRAPAKIRTQSMFPATLTIDGVEIAVRVKRMTSAEFETFVRSYEQRQVPRRADEEAAAYDARQRQAATWLREALDAFLLIVPGEFEHDGREIVSGGALADIFGGRLDVVPIALATVLLENRLSAAQKENARRVLASMASSLNELQPTVTGGTATSEEM